MKEVDAISIEPMLVPPPCTAFVLRTGKFPTSHEARSRLRVFLDRLSNVISARIRFSPEVFLQVEFMANGRDVFDQHSVEWRPEVGLGVWPNRPPPELWKPTDIFKMAVEFQRTGRMRPLMYRVLRVVGEPLVRTQAQSLMIGTGMLTSIWTRYSSEEFLTRAKSIFLPSIQSPNFRIFPFYVPLLDFGSLRDRKPGELDSWLCGDAVYLRESPSDNAIILIATRPLVPLIEESGAMAQAGQGNAPIWILGTGAD